MSVLMFQFGIGSQELPIFPECERAITVQRPEPSTELLNVMARTIIKVKIDGIYTRPFVMYSVYGIVQMKADATNIESSVKLIVFFLHTIHEHRTQSMVVLLYGFFF